MKSIKWLIIFLLIAGCTKQEGKNYIMTVNGSVSADKSGVWLTHEHLLVDFIGADSIHPGRYDRTEVVKKVLPYLRQVKDKGCKTFVECTPEYLGRDPELLRILADSTKMNILTNTGFYGAVNNKYIPSSAMSLTAEEMAIIWIKEWETGIAGTGIKPGFIKIAVDRDSLTDFHKTIIKAAAITHLATGLVIASHTGPALPAFQQIEVLQEAGVDPSAFIWVHASSEKDSSKLVEAAKKGAWISLDNLNELNVGKIVEKLKYLKEKGVLGRVLISHDAGWYDPAKEDGGDFRPFTTLFDKLIPELKNNGFTKNDIKTILETNPQQAFAVKIRKANIKSKTL